MYSASAFSQELNIVETLGNYNYKVPEHQSISHAKEYVLELSKIDAINRALGVRVQQKSVLVTVEDGSSVKQEYKVHQETMVRGDWIKTLTEPIYKISYNSSGISINVKVRGLVREIPDTRRPFILKLGTYSYWTTKYEETSQLHWRDKLLVDFKSDITGFLAIFIKQGEHVFQAIPVSKDIIKIESDQYYRFFEDENNEVVIGKQNWQLFAQVIVIFSVNKFSIGMIQPSFNGSRKFESVKNFESSIEKLMQQRPEVQVHKKWVFASSLKYRGETGEMGVDHPDEVH